MGAVKDMIPEYTDPEAARPSSNIDVIDSLTSTSATDALSANQGKTLYDLILPDNQTFTLQGVAGNFVTNYGCKIVLPFPFANKYTLNINSVTIYGGSGDKKSEFSVDAKTRNYLSLKTTSDYSGKLVTATVAATRT